MRCAQPPNPGKRPRSGRTSRLAPRVRFRCRIRGGEQAANSHRVHMSTKPLSIDRVRVLFFASLRETVGSNEVEIDITKEEDFTIESLLKVVKKRYPALKRGVRSNLVDSCSIAVNEEYILPSLYKTTILRRRDEVAFIPPVSGG